MRSLKDGLATKNLELYYPFHMPGHKRRNLTGLPLPYEIDITEITDFDDLFHAEGVIREIENKASRLYKCEETKLLVNSSTAGILSAILGCTTYGGTILITSNCHRSVFHAIELHNLNYNVFQTETIEALLINYPNTQVILVTSPSYEGAVFDVEYVREQAIKNNIPLIVDEAHGAHLGFDEYFPNSAITLGADFVIHSLHKTLPSLTQTALIHKGYSKLADHYWNKIIHNLEIFQTSSPSYPLMLSMEGCLDFLDSPGNYWEEYVTNLVWVRSSLRNLSKLKLVDTNNELIKISYGQAGNKEDKFDYGKIVISTENCKLSGFTLKKILREGYGLELELAKENYVIAMTSVADTKEGFIQLVEALFSIDKELRLEDIEIENNMDIID